MKRERYEEIKSIEENLDIIPRLKYMTEELSNKERTEYFKYKEYIKFQKEWVGIY